MSFENREGMRVGRDQEAARKAAVAKADAWTYGQAARLEVRPMDILEAIRRGWLPENIARARNKYELESNPPMIQGEMPWTARKEPAPATGETAMAEAFCMAAE